jgi:signal transduction histidine kinase
VRQRDEVAAANQLALVEQERRAVDRADLAVRDLERELSVTAVRELEYQLDRLGRVNIRYMRIAYHEAKRLTTSARRVLVTVGIASVLASTLLGLSVYRSIAPRVERLVLKIRRFRELGINEPLTDSAGDELAVLGHALDVSFRAISQRDKEREQFLAVAAHELKTPLTAMKGFAHAALRHPNDPKIRDHALAIIDRHATRLARLSQDLLWLARADANQLPFRPEPVDLAALCARVGGDVEVLTEVGRFAVEATGDTHLLGDIALLEHAISSMLMQMLALADGTVPIDVVLLGSPTRVRLAVETVTAESLPDDLEEIVEPFGLLLYEKPRGALRSTGLGLRLVRVITRMHGATLVVERRIERTIRFTLDFPR